MTFDIPLICTDFWAKPMPSRRYDWVAYYDEGPDLGVGSGATETAAIADLIENHPRSER